MYQCTAYLLGRDGRGRESPDEPGWCAGGHEAGGYGQVWEVVSSAVNP